MPRRSSGADEADRERRTDFAKSVRGPERRRLAPPSEEPERSGDDRVGLETGSACPECGERQRWARADLLDSGDKLVVECANGHEQPAPSGIPHEDRIGDAALDRVADRAASDFARSAGAPELPLGMRSIVERVFRIDPEEVYARLEGARRLWGREQKADRDTLARALDECMENAADAHRLYAHARVEREAYEIDALAQEADMRAQATAALETERTAKKEAKERSKQITEADVRSWIASRFHDQWRRWQIERKRVEMTVEHLERLSELWKSRSRTLEALLVSART